MSNQLPLPAFYDPKKVGTVFEPNYEMLASEGEKWAKQNKIKPASTDKVRIGLMSIDMENTFTTPGYELYVGGRSGTGAVDDTRRLTEFMGREMSILTSLIFTMDTHHVFQVFHPKWFVDAKGNHPAPYTNISAEDIKSGKWMVNPAVVYQIPGSNYAWLQSHILDYCTQLEAAGKDKLTVWPYHAIFPGVGYSLASSLHEMEFFHRIVRDTDPHFEIKGGNPLTENYSVLRPEVLFANKQAIAQKSTGFVKSLMEYDYLIIAGEAKSHCVKWSIEDFLDEIVTVDPSLAKKVYLLEDCTSPVVVPGVVDHTDAADAAFEKFAKAGMNIVKSTDPIESWPGIKL